MLRELYGQNVIMTEAKLLQREKDNADYLLRLDSDHLLVNFRSEAGLPIEIDVNKEIYGGWDFPTCQLRGHFLGHWLSAAAMHYYESGDRELKGKAEKIVDELEKCQQENGGEWLFSIPEKYLYWIAKGKNVWAPQYTIHKTLMGLLDVYKYIGYEKALRMCDKAADWFLRYSSNYSREEFDDILDFETGGMLEMWAELYELTGNAKYVTLMEKYYRGRLFDRLLEGTDMLSNRHANTTIPEIVGLAKAYEVTGNEKWKAVVEAYWKCAVDDRGTFATGGQTYGEIYTPKKAMQARIGNLNQEHCTVYNLIRLADFLFRWSGDIKYAEYIEKNLYNGFMAQAYYHSTDSHGLDSGFPKFGLLTYFLPLGAGSKKGWSSETQDFFCCHGSLVQANSAWNRHIYYQDVKKVFVCQYFDSKASMNIDGKDFTITQAKDTLAADFDFSEYVKTSPSQNPVTGEVLENPDRKICYFKINTAAPLSLSLNFRIPSWATKANVTLNGQPVSEQAVPGTFFVLDRTWANEDTVGIELSYGIRPVKLEGSKDKYAFCYGPILLAGLCDSERVLHASADDLSDMFEHRTERQWGDWNNTFITKGQEENIRFMPLMDIGYETYTVYFPVVRE